MSKAKTHRHTRRTKQQEMYLIRAWRSLKTQGISFTAAAQKEWRPGCGYASVEHLRKALSKFAAKNVGR